MNQAQASFDFDLTDLDVPFAENDNGVPTLRSLPPPPPQEIDLDWEHDDTCTDIDKPISLLPTALGKGWVSRYTAPTGVKDSYIPETDGLQMFDVELHNQLLIEGSA